MSRHRSRSKAPNLNTFKWNTCETIDDVTGMKVKLSDTFKRWDGVVTTRLNMESRQPQDMAVTPRAARTYTEARSQAGVAEPTPYDPNSGWGDL